MLKSLKSNFNEMSIDYKCLDLYSSTSLIVAALLAVYVIVH